MARMPARERRTCPLCDLSLIVVRTHEVCTMEYDMSDWARLCRHPGIASPLVCPALEPLLQAWLGKPSPARTARIASAQRKSNACRKY